MKVFIFEHRLLGTWFLKAVKRFVWDLWLFFFIRATFVTFIATKLFSGALFFRNSSDLLAFYFCPHLSGHVVFRATEGYGEIYKNMEDLLGLFSWVTWIFVGTAYTSLLPGDQGSWVWWNRKKFLKSSLVLFVNVSRFPSRSWFLV